jgi:hypothetical protein
VAASGKVDKRRRKSESGGGGQRSIRCRTTYEREARDRGFRVIAGVDEVGRGCLFGPVFAAAVVLDPERPIRGLHDSKILEADERERLAALIKRHCLAWAIGGADVFEIDQINIYQASRVAMRRAVEALALVPDYLLIDAVKIDLAVEQLPLIDGDARCRAIAAASIIAKAEGHALRALAPADFGRMPDHLRVRIGRVFAGVPVAAKLGSELDTAAFAISVGRLDEPVLSRRAERAGFAQPLRGDAGSRTADCTGFFAKAGVTLYSRILYQSAGKYSSVLSQKE